MMMMMMMVMLVVMCRGMKTMRVLWPRW